MRAAIVMLSAVLLSPLVVRADDQPPGQPLEFELVIIHLRSAEPIPAEQRAQSGPGILALVPDWRKAGKIEHMTTMRVSALENQKATIQIGETAGVVVGRTFGPNRGGAGGGFGQAQIQMENYGTLVMCTGRINGDAVEVEISAEQTRPGRGPSAPNAAARSGDAGGGAPAAGPNDDLTQPTRNVTQARTLVKAKSGECQVISAAWTDGNDGSTGKLVLLTPKIIGARPSR